MKFSTPVLFVGLLSVAAALPTEILSEEQRLRNFIDDIINKTISGLLSSFPDPFSYEKGHFDLSIGELSSGYADISNLLVTGIKGIVVSELHTDFAQSSLNASANVPKLSVSTNYDADVLLAKLLPVFGNGKLGLDVENVVVKVSAKYVLSPLSVHNASLHFDLDKAQFDIRGLLNNDALSALVEEVLNDNVVDFVKNHHELIDRVLSKLVNAFFDKKNSTVALSELDEDVAAFKKEFKSLNLEYNDN